MNKATLLRLTVGLLLMPILALLLALTPRPVQAEETNLPTASEKFSQEELAQMLGPIALYPDKLLSQILMASTYPLEVIEADRWVKKNPGLRDAPLDQALLDKAWDPSVKAICHFPAILSLMSERITETTNLGNAFLVQEGEVMDMVQQLRAKAHAQGNLTTTPEQKVIVEQETIVIEPTNPQVVYVPYYDPFYIYGPWWYPAYRPYYWGPPGVSLGIGLSFWPGIYFGYSWGTWGYFDWHHHHVYIHSHERPRYVRHDHWYAESGRWHHSPVHRRGVAYHDKYTASRYGQHPQRHSDFRRETRGFPERRETVGVNSRTGDERSRFDQDLRAVDNPRNEQSRQEQQRVERELRKREQPRIQAVDRDQLKREQPRPQAVDRDQLKREQPRPQAVDRDQLKREQQQPQPAEHDQQNRPIFKRDRTDQERVGQKRQEPARVDRVPEEQRRQVQQQTDQERRVREAVKSEPSQRRHETVFEVQGNDRNVRQSSERGRSSRQEWGDTRRDRGSWGGGKGSGHDGGGRNRR